jgi:hypothetical protein
MGTGEVHDAKITFRHIDVFVLGDIQDCPFINIHDFVERMLVLRRGLVHFVAYCKYFLIVVFQQIFQLIFDGNFAIRPNVLEPVVDSDQLFLDGFISHPASPYVK